MHDRNHDERRGFGRRLSSLKEIAERTPRGFGFAMIVSNGFDETSKQDVMSGRRGQSGGDSKPVPTEI